MSKQPQRAQPPEIVFTIVELLIPSSSKPPIAFPPSHETTRTLLSLTQTCRSAYTIANKFLYTHCLYIDSAHRLNCLLRTLTTPSLVSTSLLETPRLELTTSLYLAPFPGNTIKNLPIAKSIHELFTVLGPSLRHLVADIPLRSLYPFQDAMNIRPRLREAFMQLTSLETFCSVRDELYLDCFVMPNHAGKEAPVWSLWPRLKQLALYNVDVDWDYFWDNLASLEELQTLILTRADGLLNVDLKREWEKRCGKRELEIVVVNTEVGHFRHGGMMGAFGWNRDAKVKVKIFDVPTSFYGDEDESELCQEWVKRVMLRKEVPDGWEWHNGVKVEGPFAMAHH